MNIRHNMFTLTGHAQVCAAFLDPTCTVPAAESDGSVGTLNWLRANVCRFSNGPDHDRRRRLVTHELERTAPLRLRAEAYGRARAVLAGLDGRPVTGHNLGQPALDIVLPLVARPVAVGVLASALGVVADLEAAVVESTIAVGAVYLSGAGSADSDTHVARLVGWLGPGQPELVANRIGVLVQACNATGALIENALRWSGSLAHDVSVEALIAETLRFDPPARSTQRECQHQGRVTLDLAAANRDPTVFDDPHAFRPGRQAGAHLGFGFGPRSCPGQAQACALACGVLEALRERSR